MNRRFGRSEDRGNARKEIRRPHPLLFGNFVRIFVILVSLGSRFFHESIPEEKEKCEEGKKRGVERDLVPVHERSESIDKDHTL